MGISNFIGKKITRNRKEKEIESRQKDIARIQSRIIQTNNRARETAVEESIVNQGIPTGRASTIRQLVLDQGNVDLLQNKNTQTALDIATLERRTAEVRGVINAIGGLLGGGNIGAAEKRQPASTQQLITQGLNLQQQRQGGQSVGGGPVPVSAGAAIQGSLTRPTVPGTTLERDPRAQQFFRGGTTPRRGALDLARISPNLA